MKSGSYLYRQAQWLFFILLNCQAVIGWAESVHSADVSPVLSVEQIPPVKDNRELLPLDELRVFTEAIQRIQSTYVKKVDTKTLLGYALKGMVNELDPHSAYLKPSDYKDLEISTSGQFGGLGIEVTMEDGFIRVVSPIDDTPAAAAGIQTNDLIVKIDGHSVKNMSLVDAVEKMRGKPGLSVKLNIVRKNERKPFDVTLKRAIIKVQSVKTRQLAPGYELVRISQFQADTDKELLTALNALKKQQTEGLKGLVLDLRNNPGGVLQSAVGVADAFVDKGLIVYTQGRIPNANLNFKATPGNTFEKVPLVVLINGGSASASEIVAGAIKDHKRGILMGTKTFGKGSVQTVLPLSVDQERGLKLTTALYYTPSGRSIQAEGIVPDIMVPKAKVVEEVSNAEYKESDLQHHLDNGNAAHKTKKGHARKDKDKNKGAKRHTEDKISSGKNDAITEDTQALLEKDYQLSQALTVLKGMSFQSDSKPSVTENKSQSEIK
ncbi:putative CtpA-like serine protease [invertebrate metagenome]|uniref:Putative CtpA-like serine protease n=1 Tax=invertebrate metagenome TaxID=1711999 RepID=A0A2H9T9W9_9ZZZZ